MRIINITDLSAPELDIYARMSENQLAHIYEPASGLFIAESPKVIERALDAGYEPVSILLEDRHVEGQCADIIKRCGDIPIYTAPFDVLTKLTGFALTRGMLCAMRRTELLSVESVCEHAARIAVLEEVMNPTNVGAIFRSAAALGMDAVLLTPGCSDPLYRGRQGSAWERCSRYRGHILHLTPWVLHTIKQIMAYGRSLGWNNFTVWASGRHPWR